MSQDLTKTKPTKLVNLWERLELKLDGDKQQAKFITRIEDIGEDTITVESPVRIEGKLNIAIGQELEVAVNKNDAAYVFRALVTNIDSDREKLTALKPISKVKRTQRRQFVRIDIAGDITFKAVNTAEPDKGTIGSEKKGELLNISAGGILIITYESLSSNDIVLMNFRMKNSRKLDNILGLVKRVDCSLDDETGKTEYLAGVEFLSEEIFERDYAAELSEYLPVDTKYFTEALQQLIVQYVYKQQVEQRSKVKVKL